MVDLTSVDEKIKRSKEHINNLKQRIDRFDKGQPYEMIEQSNPERPENRQGILRILRPIPPGIPLAAGDAVHNLRSALDHLVWAAVGPNATNQTAFPIWRSE